MRKLFAFLLVLLLLVLPSAAYFHDYTIFDDTSWADVPAFDPGDVPSSSFWDALIPALQSVAPSDNLESYDLTDIEIMPLYSLDNGTTPINTGLRSVMRSVIGNYSPVVVQYQYTNGTNTQYLREILPDYEWMFNFGLFSLVLYCTFRMGSAVLCRL